MSVVPFLYLVNYQYCYNLERNVKGSQITSEISHTNKMLKDTYFDLIFSLNSLVVITCVFVFPQVDLSLQGLFTSLTNPILDTWGGLMSLRGE